MVTDILLSRVADSLYWMSRYLERAEHSARLIDVNLNLSLEQSNAATSDRWRRIKPLLGDQKSDKPYDITQAATFDLSNANSIVSCIATARENARQVREQISTEMWEALNALYLQSCRASLPAIWADQPWEFFRGIREGSHLFQGITDATMNHNDGWQFIQVGRAIERAGATARLLQIQFEALEEGEVEESDFVEWAGILRCCTSFEAYCKVYTADIRTRRVADFLLLNNESPRSVCYSVEQIKHSLDVIAEGIDPHAHKSTLANRRAGKLRAMLSYAQIDEIMGETMQDFLIEIQEQCWGLHEAIYQTFINYPIESAIAS